MGSFQSLEYFNNRFSFLNKYKLWDLAHTQVCTISIAYQRVLLEPKGQVTGVKKQHLTCMSSTLCLFVMILNLPDHILRVFSEGAARCSEGCNTIIEMKHCAAQSYSVVICNEGSCSLYLTLSVRGLYLLLKVRIETWEGSRIEGLSKTGNPPSQAVW